jgi:hypothetical protein
MGRLPCSNAHPRWGHVSASQDRHDTFGHELVNAFGSWDVLWHAA